MSLVDTLGMETSPLRLLGGLSSSDTLGRALLSRYPTGLIVAFEEGYGAPNSWEVI